MTDKHKKNNNSENLTPEEKWALANLKQDIVPPENLEARTVTVLHKRGLLNAFSGEKKYSFTRVALAGGMAAMIFFAGFFVGKQPADVGKDFDKGLFALFLFEPPQLAPGLEEAALVREYGNWARGLYASGQFASGEKLKMEGRKLRQKDTELSVMEVSKTGPVEILSGYFLIEAENLAAAQTIAATCPHLKYGGYIELREIERH